MQIKTNEILYRIQKALNLTTEEMLEAYKLEAYEMEASHLESLLKRRQDDGFRVATYEELGVFLDGLVTLKRGPSPKKPNDDEAVELTNNLILKKLRIALELKNFKECSDELLMAFLEGLDEFFYFGSDET
jgi:uncharacterized protein YehS (DUF1456 family)